MFILALCATSFLATLMYASISPFFKEIGDDIDASVPAMGQIVTARVLLSSLLAILAGSIADRVGYRRMIGIGLVALVITFFGVSVSQSYAMLLATSIPGGIAGAILTGLPLALAGTRFDGEERRKALSYVVASLSSSAIVGVPALTTLSAFVGWRGVFAATAVISGIAGVFILRALPEDVLSENPGPLSVRSIIGPYRVLLGDRRMQRLYSSTVLRATGWIGYLTYIGAYLADEVGMGIGAVGLVYMVSGACYTGGSLLAGRSSIDKPPAKIASVMTFIGAIMVVLLASVPSIPAIVVFGVAGISLASSLAWVMFTTMMSTYTPTSQSVTMSFNSTTQNLGAATGGILGGVLIAVGGYQVMGIGLGIVLMASSLIILLAADQFTQSS